jgi:hypothetical protein
VILAAGGQSPGWFGFLLAVSAIYTIGQLLVVLGRDVHLPLMPRTSSKSGAAGLLMLNCAFTLFFVVCLIQTL